MFEVPNLDDELPANPDDLYEAARVFRMLAEYADRRGNAVVDRINGRIESARKLEATNERLYNQLPDWARW